MPENTLKFVVGVMLTSFGTFWGGEGLGIEWWYDDPATLNLDLMLRPRRWHVTLTGLFDLFGVSGFLVLVLVFVVFVLFVQLVFVYFL